MNLKEHEEYLTFLKSILAEAKDTPFGEFGLAIPKQKGAFYFGEVSLPYYIELYEKELNKLTFMNEKPLCETETVKHMPKGSNLFDNLSDLEKSTICDMGTPRGDVGVISIKPSITFNGKPISVDFSGANDIARSISKAECDRVEKDIAASYAKLLAGEPYNVIDKRDPLYKANKDFAEHICSLPVSGPSVYTPKIAYQEPCTVKILSDEQAEDGATD